MHILSLLFCTCPTTCMARLTWPWAVRNPQPSVRLCMPILVSHHTCHTTESAAQVRSKRVLPPPGLQWHAVVRRGRPCRRRRAVRAWDAAAAVPQTVVVGCTNLAQGTTRARWALCEYE